MELYEVLGKVAQSLTSNADLQTHLFYYLKDTMDDDGEFTRSRYQKRPEQEGPIPNRELGPIQYIICGCTKPFHPSQVRYITDEELVDFQAEIIWNRDKECLEEDKALLQQSGYEHLTIIPLIITT